MHLSRLFIKNYRSIQQLDVCFGPGKNVIVGRNNSGKSNILSAIDLVLGENSPDYKKSDNIKESDFYTKKIKTGKDITEEIADKMFIWCELTRKPGEALDWTEVNKCFGFRVYSTGYKSPQRKFLKLESIGETYNEIFDVDEDEVGTTYLNPKLLNQKPFEEEFNDKYRFAFAFRAKRDADGIHKEIRFLYRVDESTGWALAFKAYLRNALLQSAIIPSFRDPQSQLRISAWSWYGKLLRHLTDDSADLPKVTEALGNLRTAANEVFATAQKKISQASLGVAFPGTELSFQFSTDKTDDLHKSCVIYVDDGFKSLLIEKGSGIQSATIIGLFNFYTSEVNITGSALLGIEEPELYLHPHARRVISERLDDFLDSNRNQVIITTHSIEFLRMAGTEVTVVLVKKSPDGHTSAQSVGLKQFKSLLRDNNQNELFFADKVVVCEGFDEYVIKAASHELFRRKLDAENVSVVAVSGKDNIAALVRLILKLELQCYVVSDFDFLLRDGSEDRKRYGAKAHDSVVSLPLEYFCQPCIFGNRGKDVIAELQKLRAKIKSEAEEAFFTAKQVTGAGFSGLGDALASLRNAGLGILDGQIEDLSTEPGFLSSTNKLDLDKVYEIRARLNAGTKFSSFMSIDQLRQVLAAVFRDRPTDSETQFEAFKSTVRKIVKS
jgi:putative ATP-dependent endonuclease of the OLD family